MTLTDFVSEQDGKANVDWKKLKRFRNRIFREGDGEKSFQPIFEQLLDYLTAKNILTYSSETSWTLTGGGFDMSPKKPAPNSQLYFVRREDAQAYKDAFYEHILPQVSIKPARETI